MNTGNPSPEQLVRNVQEYRQRMRNLERDWRTSKGGQAIAGAYECASAANDMRVMRVGCSAKPFATYLPHADDLLGGRGTTEADAFIDLLGKLGAV